MRVPAFGGRFPVARVIALAAVLSGACPAQAEIEITEIMYGPGGPDALWEWIEIRNTSASAVNLDGWVFDDDDDPLIHGEDGAPDANILAANGNTIVAAGGVAVLYPADKLGFDPTRFTRAWGNAITLIPVDRFTSLTSGDAIGLWPSHAAYAADALPGTTAPRRSFSHAATSLNFHANFGFPTASDRFSIAWNGAASYKNGNSWVESESGLLGAVESDQTLVSSTAINDIADLGNPGMVPAGARPAGLLITEIMFNPASPAVASGYSEGDFEWLEILNNTPADIDFATTNYVFDDVVGDTGGANIKVGSLAVGEVGVLFNSAKITPADMTMMWGDDINFIPVADWPSLNNGSETIAIWDSESAYDLEAFDDARRAAALAVAAVSYNTVASQGWPTTNDRSSIFLANLTESPGDAESWVRSGTDDDSLASWQPEPLSRAAVDHPGGDVGSPGYVPGANTPAPLFGDYNSDGRVDAADYTAWRDRLNTAATLPNDETPGSVGPEDYAVWKSNFGAAPGHASSASAPVPEPGSIALLLGGAGILYSRAISPRTRT